MAGLRAAERGVWITLRGAAEDGWLGRIGIGEGAEIAVGVERDEDLPRGEHRGGHTGGLDMAV